MKRTQVGLSLVVVLALLAGGVAGCFLGGGGTACYQEDPKACTEFTGEVYTKAMVKDSCEYEVRSKGCPTEDMVGKCSLNTNFPNELVIFYYSPANTQETARETCAAAGGDFQAP